MSLFAIAAVVIAVISAGYSVVMANRAKGNASSGAGFEVTRYGTNEAIPVIYGTREVSPTLVYQGVRDITAADAKNETLYIIAVWCAGQVDAIEQVYYGDLEEEEYSGSEVWHHLGDGTDPTGSWPEWWEPPEAMAGITGKDLCYSLIRLQNNNKQDRFPSGRPDFSARIRGKHIHDPRTGITGYSENPALVMLDYLKSDDYGKGMTDDQIELSTFLLEADFCDEVVNTPDGDQPRMTCNTLVDTAESLLNNVNALRFGMRGELFPAEFGRIKLIIEKDADPVMDIDETHMVGGTMSSAGVNKSDRLNQYVLRFADKTGRFQTQEAVYPEFDSALDKQWLAEDNGMRLSQEEEFDSITNYYEALEMAELLVKLSREGISGEFTGTARLLPLECGDVIGISNELRGWVRKPFRITEISRSNDGTAKFSFIEHQKNLYPWSSKPNAPTWPDTTHANPYNVPTPTGLKMEQDIDGRQVKFSWSGDRSLGYYVTVVRSDGFIAAQSDTELEYAYFDTVPLGQYTLQVQAYNALTVSTAGELGINVTTKPLADRVADGGRYYETIYLASDTTPPRPTGSQPTGWSTSPPSSSAMIWASNGFKESTGTLVSGYAWSLPAQWKGAKGDDGADGRDGTDGSDGNNGDDGARGAGTFTKLVYGLTSWSNSQANAAVSDGKPVLGDVVTLIQSENVTKTGYRETRRCTQASPSIVWTAYAVSIDGNALIEGTVDVIDGQIDVRSNTSGSRLEIKNESIKLYTDNSATPTTVISPTLSKFGGTVYAANIEGDVVDLGIFAFPAGYTTTDVRGNPAWQLNNGNALYDGGYYRFCSITLPAEALFARTLRVKANFGVSHNDGSDQIYSGRLQVRRGSTTVYTGATRSMPTGANEFVEVFHDEVFELSVPASSSSTQFIFYFNCVNESGSPSRSYVTVTPIGERFYRQVISGSTYQKYSDEYSDWENQTIREISDSYPSIYGIEYELFKVIDKKYMGS